MAPIDSPAQKNCPKYAPPGVTRLVLGNTLYLPAVYCGGERGTMGVPGSESIDNDAIADINHIDNI
jgi:hypothetical protein